ncbi:MAG: hypothetical protein M0Z58_06590 [Nitrospiraceae bacterium]|nr:hypothetical protein [Nitrospiraceae bacterium]
MHKYDSMKGSFEFTLENENGRRVSAEAVAVVRPENVRVSIYHTGMLVGNLEDLAEKRGLDYEVYREALQKALLWWALGGYETRDLPGAVMVTSGDLRLVLAARTYVPVGETICMAGGDLVVTYSDYRPVGGFWYPFRIGMEYHGARLDLRANHIELAHS